MDRQPAPFDQQPAVPRRVGVLVAPRTVFVWCVAVAVGFLIADLVTMVAVGAGTPHNALLIQLFDTDVENNPPTWFSSLMLSAAALAAFIHGRQERDKGTEWVRHWYGLAALFLLMSLDESAVLHEQTVGPIVDAVALLGVSADVARIGAVLVVCVGLAMLAAPLWRWFRGLPGWARRAYVIAVVLFVGAALGMEAVARLLEIARGYRELEQDLLSGIEEFLEMLGGITLLVTTLALMPGEAAADEAPEASVTPR